MRIKRLPGGNGAMDGSKSLSDARLGGRGQPLRRESWYGKAGTAGGDDSTSWSGSAGDDGNLWVSMKDVLMVEKC